MFERVAYERHSGRKLHAWLKDEIKFKTKNGKMLTLSNLYLILRNHFYYGVFEYPKNSGQWYTGKHIPIITKELFDLTQERIREHVIKTNGKEFAFVKLMTCGLCGSGICADEKVKVQKNGNIHHYVYYRCTQFKDHKCPNKAIREDILTEQLVGVINQIDLDEIGIKARIKDELERHKKFQSSLLKEKPSVVEATNIDIRNYAKYILREGAVFEKREILSCLKSRLVMENRKISINS